jgi:hypothetical protein
MTTTAVVVDSNAPSDATRKKSRVTSTSFIWAPLLILTILSAPSITSLLPATQDYLDEIYQPLRALKFFASHGKAFHKYGPAPNFFLAPGYVSSLGYWKVTGSFGRPSDNYPYGFKHPFEQMGFLILQGRVLFLLIGLIGLGALAQSLTTMTSSRLAIGFALLFCLATDYMLAYELPTARPDSAMIGFSALALACYVRMVFQGFTVRRGIWMSIWAACAVSSKELAAPMFVLPYIGLIVMALRGHRETVAASGRAGALRVMAWSIAAGVICYLLLNVVYAPHTWLARMKYWLAGPGIDADVWGHGTPWERALALLNNFGPAGSIVVLVALIAFLIARPKRWIMLLLPAVSVAALGLARIAYPADRFYTILCLALFPVVAAGLSVLLPIAMDASRRAPLQRAAIVCLCILGLINFWFATLTWYQVHSTFESEVERHALANVPKTQRVYTLNEYPYNPGSTRMEWLGYHHDPRSIQQIASQKTNLPDWIYTTEGKLGFLDDARHIPGRAAMLNSEKGSPFDINQWHGLEGIGYHLERTIVPATPKWYPFNWMPAVQTWKSRKALLVYRLNNELAPGAPASR